MNSSTGGSYIISSIDVVVYATITQPYISTLAVTDVAGSGSGSGSGGGGGCGI